MAAAGPTKVQPPSEETVSSPNDVAFLLGKNGRRSRIGRRTSMLKRRNGPLDLNDRAKASRAPRRVRPPSQPIRRPLRRRPLVVVAAPPPTATPAPASATPAPCCNRHRADVKASAPAERPLRPRRPRPRRRPLRRPPWPRARLALLRPPRLSRPSDAAPTALISPGWPKRLLARLAPARPSRFCWADALFLQEPKRVERWPRCVRTAPSSTPPAPDHAAQQPIEPAYTLPPADPLQPSRSPADAVAAEPATPKLDLPAKPAGKTTTRVPIAKIDTTAATATSQSPEARLQVTPPSQRENAAKKREANARVAAAEAAPPAPAQPVAAPVAEKTPLKSLLSAILPGQDSADTAPRPTATATAAAEAPPASGGDNFSVQLAAPESEAEAQSASTRLKAKFSGALGGLEPVIHKAGSERQNWFYRVRVGPLSHSAAITALREAEGEQAAPVSWRGNRPSFGGTMRSRPSSAAALALRSARTSASS